MKPFFRAATGGYIICTAVNSLSQDAMGKEAFLKMMADCWLPASITVPIAIVFLIIGWSMIPKDKP